MSGRSSICRAGALRKIAEQRPRARILSAAVRTVKHGNISRGQHRTKMFVEWKVNLYYYVSRTALSSGGMLIRTLALMPVPY